MWRQDTAVTPPAVPQGEPCCQSVSSPSATPAKRDSERQQSKEQLRKTPEVRSEAQPEKTKRETKLDTTRAENERKAKADKDARDFADKALKSSDGFLGDNDPEPDLIESLVTDFTNSKILEGAFGVAGRNLGIALDFLNPVVLAATDTPNSPGTPGYKLSAEERAIIGESLQDSCQKPPAKPSDKAGLLEQDLKPIIIP